MTTSLSAPVHRPHRTHARRIVVGVDGTASSRAALAWAVDDAAATGAHLTICRVGPPARGQAPTSPVDTPDHLELARSVQRIRAAARDADLLVVGAGTPTAKRVLADAEGPVVAVRPVGSGACGPYAGQVVVAVAGASVDPLALRFGFDYAAAHRLPLVAVHVSGQPPGDFWFDERTLETHFAVEPPALGVLGATVEPMLPQYPGVPVRLGVLAGDPVRRLVGAARGARLTVVGRRHRRLGVRLLGSVSRAVVAAVDGPVAVVPALRRT